MGLESFILIPIITDKEITNKELTHKELANKGLDYINFSFSYTRLKYVFLLII